MSLQGFLEDAWLPYYFIPVLAVVAVARIDVIGWNMFQSVSNPASVYVAMENFYMNLFHGLVYVSVLAPTLVVYYYQGLSSGLAYLSWSLAVLYSGVWDLLYYLFRDGALPQTLSHLKGKPPGFLAGVLGRSVTWELVFLNSVVFVVAGLFLAFSLRRGRLSHFFE